MRLIWQQQLFASLFSILVGMALLMIAPVQAQTPEMDAARADGKAFGKSQIPASQAQPTKPDGADALPGYDPRAADPLGDYFDHEGAMSGDGLSQINTNPGSSIVINSRGNRILPSTVRSELDRGFTITGNPTSYVTGYSGDPRDCRPVPPGTGGIVDAERLCNRGDIEAATNPSCTIGITHRFDEKWDYECDSGDGSCGAYAGCTRTGSRPGRCLLYFGCPSGPPRSCGCAEPGDPILKFSCPVETGPVPPVNHSVVYRGSDPNPAACAPLSTNPQCTGGAEVCTDGSATRVINGASITLPCWQWSKSYTCTTLTPGAADCGTLDSDASCSFVREYCISESDPCHTWERVYSCKIPGTTGSGPQYLCDAQVYCANGNCEKIVHEVNDEFAQAATALEVATQAQKELDPNSLTLFKGSRETCTKTIFGITNCCAPRGVPIFGFGCSAADMSLKTRRDKGLCHYVGTYCSAKALFVCLAKKEVHCCFMSKLTRILQEQGRTQLGLAWAEPKKETCNGFTIDQFSQLDLSRMDFSEVEADFVSAAVLPDEVAALTSLQGKIEDYYRANGH
jgi:conjugal transfer mating pair stabilization protein TraN